MSNVVTPTYNTIYNENCLNTLKRIENDSVDLVITSPPYNMNLRIRNGKYASRQIIEEFSSKYQNFTDNIPIKKYYEFHSQVLKELLRVSDLIFYNIQIVTGSKRAMFRMIGNFADNLKDIIVWDKGYGQPAIEKQVINKRSELILVFEKDYPISRKFRKRGKFEKGELDDVWVIPRVKKSHKTHKAVFPNELVRKILINFSEPGDLIYDPFMGSGTTAVVAKQMNRNFLGSEIDEQYIEIANERLKNIQSTFFN
jgi:site-specific DNA-methyltransferase (adenine-specific)